MNEQKYFQYMRSSNWNKAKAYLNNILDTFYSNNDEEIKNFNILNNKVNEFIKYMEEESPIA